ncbi:hypothetical protein B0I35DRAFT_514781 [Stachybotrys elegans]|uniref:Uncharacterized protein n=1 Tax=Stachybotrys elegans TaxID=80388 RepID=A0A8K0SKK2_9HYPO|nr:hypothetical protein B0I35DRAFT_514781 [Stachybotrys elegans]
MQSLKLRFITALTYSAAFAAAESCSGCNTFPASWNEFSSSFKQPEPPTVKASFEASFIQHKWDESVSHITAGYIVNSPSQHFVRADQAEGGQLSSSFFNYENVTETGLVENILTTYDPDSKEPTVWRDYVNSNFPLFQEDFLISAGASFSGVVERQFAGRVAAWSIMYQGVIPVTVFVDGCNTLVGYEYFSPGRRTRVTTQYFNIKA